MPGLIDYFGATGGAEANNAIGAALQQAFQQGQARKVAEAQKARALDLQAQEDAARQAFIKNPNATTGAALTAYRPADWQAVKAAHEAKSEDQRNGDLRDLSRLRGLLDSGRTTEAQDFLKRRIDADKAAGVDTADDQQLYELIPEDPDAARGTVNAGLYGIMGKDFDKAFTAVSNADIAAAKLPSEVGENVASAANLTASAGKTVAETREVAPNAVTARKLDEARVRDIGSQIATRAAQLELDADKLQTNTQLELEKLYAKGTPMSGASEQAMTSATLGAESSRQLADRAARLATDIEKANLSGGWFAALGQITGNASGAPNLLRKEYQSLISQQAVKNLPPGPASDKDIQLAMKGFPAATANKETVASFLRGMAKLQGLSANMDQARADWISDNGNIGRATKDITVNGVRVPKGSTFADFSKSASAAQRRTEGATTAADFNAKYGNGR